MNKVTIEVTPNGWTTTLELNGKKFVEQWTADSNGAGTTTPSLESQVDIPDELLEAIDDNHPYDLMRNL